MKGIEDFQTLRKFERRGSCIPSISAACLEIETTDLSHSHMNMIVKLAYM